MDTSAKAVTVCLLALSLLVSGCGPGQVFGPTITPTVTATSTSTPTLTPVPPTPTFTSTPTPIPGPEPIVYLPTVADLPQCKWIEYSVGMTSARLLCNLPGNINLSATVTASDKLLTEADLIIHNPVVTLTVPTIGQAAIAAEVEEGGKEIQLFFYKGNAMIRISNFNPNGKANLDDVVTLAQQVERLLPDQIVPPATLPFPDVLDEEAFKNYFHAISITVFDFASQRFDDISEGYTEGRLICFQDYPKKASREQFMIGLYNVQTQKIETKAYYEMLGYRHCSAVLRNIKVGDKYEYWIAVGDTLVAVYPFEMK